MPRESILANLSYSFKTPDGSPYVRYNVLVTEFNSNTPARLYQKDGLLTSADGRTVTDNFGYISVYVLDGRPYSITLLTESGAVLDKSLYVEAQSIQKQAAPTGDGVLNGFISENEVALSWDNATRTIIVSPVSGSYGFYSSGILYRHYESHSIQIPNTFGVKFVYFDENGQLKVLEQFSQQLTNKWTWVTSIYWNPTQVKAIPDALRETHGVVMPADVHLYLHNTKGTAFQSGLLPSCNATGNGSTIDHIQVACAAGIIRDEDLVHNIPSRALANTIPVCYRLGANAEWHVDASGSTIVRPTGTGRAAWNEYTGGAWQLTEITTGDFVLAHLYAVPGLTEKYMIVMGTRRYTTSAQGRAAARYEVMDIEGLPVVEAKLIASFLVQSANTYTNAVKARIVQTDTGSNEPFVDWRHVATVASVPSGVPPVIPV